MQLPVLLRVFPTAASLTLLTVLAGCSKDNPAAVGLYPVRGTVLSKSGQPFAGGSIDFRPVDNSPAAASGEIGVDGTFSLSSVIGDNVHPGAKPGQYRVTVIPRMGADQSATPPIELKARFAIEPKENQLTIKLE